MSHAQRPPRTRWSTIPTIGLLIAMVVLVAFAGRARGAALPAGPWPVSHDLLVAEVVTGGDSASDEWIELFNAGSSPVDLGGLELLYVSATGGSVSQKAEWSGSTLRSGRSLLLANGAGGWASVADVTWSGASPRRRYGRAAVTWRGHRYPLVGYAANAWLREPGDAPDPAPRSNGCPSATPGTAATPTTTAPTPGSRTCPSPMRAPHSPSRRPSPRLAPLTSPRLAPLTSPRSNPRRRRPTRRGSPTPSPPTSPPPRRATLRPRPRRRRRRHSSPRPRRRRRRHSSPRPSRHRSPHRTRPPCRHRSPHRPRPPSRRPSLRGPLCRLRPRGHRPPGPTPTSMPTATPSRPRRQASATTTPTATPAPGMEAVPIASLRDMASAPGRPSRVP